jgi:5-oxoprolinase (ATP-hydrolysing) subunit A
MTITLNSDMGESFGIHSFGNDDGLLPLIDSANVACGFHAGDPVGIHETVTKAAAAGVAIGAHPGLPDAVGFGRREMKLFAEEVRDLVLYQVAAVKGFLDMEGVPLDHIKPHGSLYGMVGREEELMDAVCDVAVMYGVPIYGMTGTAHERVAARRRVDFVGEYYVDLRYRPDGTLIIPRRPQATAPDVAASRGPAGDNPGGHGDRGRQPNPRPFRQHLRTFRHAERGGRRRCRAGSDRSRYKGSTLGGRILTWLSTPCSPPCLGFSIGDQRRTRLTSSRRGRG